MDARMLTALAERLLDDGMAEKEHVSIAGFRCSLTQAQQNAWTEFYWASDLRKESTAVRIKLEALFHRALAGDDDEDELTAAMERQVELVRLEYELAKRWWQENVRLKWRNQESQREPGV